MDFSDDYCVEGRPVGTGGNLVGSPELVDDSTCRLRRRESEAMMEALRQELHGWKLRAETAAAMEEAAREEIECLKEDLKAAAAESGGGGRNAEVRELKAEVEVLREELHLKSRDLESTLKKLTAADAAPAGPEAPPPVERDQPDDCLRCDEKDEEIRSGSEKIQSLQASLERLGGACSVAQAENEGLLDRIENLKADLASTRAQLADAEAEVVGYQQSMNQIRDEMDNMHSELTETDAEDAGKQRGNSLFSEVDDRRQIVERQLQKMKDRMEEMQAQYSRKVQQLNKVKTQNMALLNKASNEASSYMDRTNLRHLEDLLNREKSKNLVLLERVNELETARKCGESGSKRSSKTSSSSAGTTLSSQLHLRQLLEAEDRLQDMTRKVGQLQRSESKLVAQNYKLKIEVDELRQKLKESSSAVPDDVKPALVLKKEILNFKKQGQEKNTGCGPVEQQGALFNSSQSLEKNDENQARKPSSTKSVKFSCNDEDEDDEEENKAPFDGDGSKVVVKASKCLRKSVKGSEIRSAEEEAQKMQDQCAQQ